MKYFKLILFFFMICATSINAEVTYTNKYDKIDIDALIKNERLLKHYVNCLLDREKCRPDGEELKRFLPEALETECAKCTDAQKIGSRRIITHLIKNKREWWNELEKKYDPKKLYITRYAKELEKQGIKL
ncbi:hypothetical protein WA026_019000 [Henosepilachna vigintioctopunctata]|uniref:Chemosensory protein n=1 Tax=Henosepilachna vigintioctopunctata TaxID=420089 RepID=A0AAW1VBY2_9CUCU